MAGGREVDEPLGRCAIARGFAAGAPPTRTRMRRTLGFTPHHGGHGMPLLVIQYTANIGTDVTALCRKLAETLLSVRDEQGGQVYPEGGLKVMAFPATHYAVGDGKHDEHAFMYFMLRIIEGRSEAVVKETGDRIMQTIREHIEPVFSRSPIGVTFHLELQPIATPKPIVMAYEGRHNNLRAIYGR